TDVNSVAGMLVGGVEVSEPKLSLTTAATKIYSSMRAKGSNIVTGVVFTEQCTEGGSVAIDDSSASEVQFTKGDKITISTRNCKEPGLPAMNGSIQFTVTSVSGDPLNSFDYGLGLALAFSGFSLINGTDSLTIDGNLDVTVNQSGFMASSFNMSGKSLSLTAATSGVVTKNYQLLSYNLNGADSNGIGTLSGTYTVAGSSPKLGGTYAYDVEATQLVVDSNNGSYPSAGSLVVRGSPATVTVTALNNASVQVDYSEQGDGAVTATSTLDWDALAALN